MKPNILMSEDNLNSLFKRVKEESTKGGYRNIYLNLENNEQFSDISNLKLQIVRDILGFYNKYPTLHSLDIIYTTSYSGNDLSNVGWYANISQIGWDTVENLKCSQEYKDMNVNLYAFCSNSMNQKKSLDIIPYEGGLTSKIKIQQELNEHFQYLKSELGKELYQLLQDERKDQDIILKNYIHFQARNWDGWKNSNLEKDIKEFLGQELVAQINYIRLDNKIEVKTNDIRRKKI